jgi:hypothetical protein
MDKNLSIVPALGRDLLNLKKYIEDFLGKLVIDYIFKIAFFLGFNKKPQFF